MKKFKFALIIIILIAICSIIIYLNYDNIVDYVTTRKWEIADSVAKINIDKYLRIEGTSTSLIVVSGDDIKGYSNSAEEKFKIEGTFKDAITKADGIHLAIAEKAGSKVCLISDNKKIWDLNINGEILNVSVNKNGYVSIIYSQSGYKSLVKAIKPNGEEIFTSYLASTYAVDTDISNDNKVLAIAEVNTEGIKIQSSIKFIRIDKLEDELVDVINLNDNTFVLDIEYTDKNELLVLEDSCIEVIKSDGTKNEIVKYSYSDTSFAGISENGSSITVNKNNKGIFETEYVLNIYKSNGEKNTYILPNSPKQISILNKTIAVDLGSEILFINTNAKLIKKCYLNGQVKEMKLYLNGNMACLVFRDRLELIKI